MTRVWIVMLTAAVTAGALALAEVIRSDWPAPFNLVAVPQACDPVTSECAIALGWAEPFANPLPPVEVVGEALGCNAVHVTFAPDWPYPTTTRVYADDVYVGENPDDRIGFDASGVPRGVTHWALDSYSTTHGTDYASVKTAPIAIDTRQVCPLPGDCVPPFDDVVTLFDVLRAIDAVLGHVDPGVGCDQDCNGGTDLFDVLGDVDVVLGRIAPPEVPCSGGSV